jgi:hypothetical protein
MLCVAMALPTVRKSSSASSDRELANRPVDAASLDFRHVASAGSHEVRQPWPDARAPMLRTP